jgi:hypothetical protein
MRPKGLLRRGTVMSRLIGLAGTLLMLLLPAAASGQDVENPEEQEGASRPIDIGSLILGGDINALFLGGGGGEEYAQIVFQPRGLAFVHPGVAIGGTVRFVNQWLDGLHAISVGLGPEAAYYFDVGSPISYPFVALSTNYSWAESGFDLESHRFSVGGRLGLAIFVAHNVSVTVSVPFGIGWSKSKSLMSGSEWGQGTYSIAAAAGIDAFVF